MIKPVLDPCCGSRMWWFDKSDPRAVFGDWRSETIVVTDRSHDREHGSRVLRIEPDLLLDFRALPYPDNSFHLVAFDPRAPGARRTAFLAGRQVREARQGLARRLGAPASASASAC